MNIIKTLIFLLIFTLNIRAQTSQNRIGFGFDYLSLDLPDDMVFSTHLNYERKFTGRFFISGNLGYLNYKGKDSFSNTLPEKRQRLMLNIKPSFAVLKLKNNYFKIGAGPSFWYRNDQIVSQIRFLLDSPSQIIDYTYRNNKGINAGLYVFSELDIALFNNFSMVGTFGFLTFNGAGNSSTLGITAYYNLN